MSRKDKIIRYVEARESVVVLKAQLAAFPALKGSRPFVDELNAAIARANEYMRSLTGGQIGEAERALRARLDERAAVIASTGGSRWTEEDGPRKRG